MTAPPQEDTIAAISTPLGEGGVGIVRLSGPRALETAARLFVSSRGRDIRTTRQQVFHGHISDRAGTRIDEVLLHVMYAPHSYTAEDVVEINGHGGMAPLRAILDALLGEGARLARPGEFTRRAFINGRIDLSRAEAVIDVIQAKTGAALQAANAAADGLLSRALVALREELADALARIEAAVDFPEDDLPDLVDAPLLERLRGAHAQMLQLEKTADVGMLYHEGVTLAIVGKPNVGKSSLFNALLRDARAIVSARPGTTRDRIEAAVNIGGIPVQLVDTAGMRDARDEVEAMGVDLARQAARNASIVLFVTDHSVPCSEEDSLLAQSLMQSAGPLVLVCNKADLPRAPGTPPCDVLPGEGRFVDRCHVSATTGVGLRELEERIAALLLGEAPVAVDSPMLFRAHQRDSMRRAAACLDRLLGNVAMSPEFLAMELRDALRALGEITGETTPEEILDRIFSAFCIGK